MDQKTGRLYPSAPFENNDLEKRLEKKQVMSTVLVIQSTTSKN